MTRGNVVMRNEKVPGPQGKSGGEKRFAQKPREMRPKPKAETHNESQPAARKRKGG